MNLLDWLLVVLLAAYALSGYWQGFITGAFATVGLLLGGLLGIVLAPIALGDADPSLWVSLGALFIVIVGATLGQALMQYAGSRIREHVTWQPARALDAVGGAVLSAAAVVVVAWALGLAVTGSRIGAVTPLVRDSEILSRVDQVLPDQASSALEAFNGVVGTTFFPRYLEPFADEDIREVGPGPRRLLTDPDVENAASSVLKIRGQNECGRGIEGSGFLYGDDRLMTNAHVVAGVDDPEVEIGDTTVTAEVVVYDPDLDLAVLALDDADRPTLEFSTEGRRSQGVAVLGYPEDGPYDVQPGRIRAQQRLRSPDIYGEGSVIREVFSVRGLVRPGNSGGPIVSSTGNVVGVVFAASVSDDDTGYALTATQVADSAAAGIARSTPVDTGTCTT